MYNTCIVHVQTEYCAYTVDVQKGSAVPNKSVAMNMSLASDKSVGMYGHVASDRSVVLNCFFVRNNYLEQSEALSWFVVWYSSVIQHNYVLNICSTE